MIEVSLETGENRRQVVANAVRGLGDAFSDKCRQAETILIKVNLVHHENQLASTHIDAVRGVLDVIRNINKCKVIVADASYHGTKAAFRNFGYNRLLEEFNFVELQDLNDDDFVDGYSVKADGSRNPIRRSKTAVNADLKISLAPMKLHRDTAVSLSVKNWTIGTWVTPPRVSASGMVWARWPWLHEEGAWAHHASIMELYRQVPCDVGIVDGILAMEGDGPSSGEPVQMGVVLAGMDAVAVDAVSATLMSIDPSEVGYLVMCAEAGLGVIDLTRINVPPMMMSEITREFSRPPGFEGKIMQWKSGAPESLR
ncbi:MAG: DUF362 domain-containing protein [Candidatus Uhrbacteria bacterium]|nr:DUF362 domain-containing protein [Candidatus Uhrbacteria bacterium]